MQLCRAPYTPGTAVPNWGLRTREPARARAAREGGAAAAAAAAALGGGAAAPSAPPCPVDLDASSAALSRLGVPRGLARLAQDEAARVGLRVFLLDNSGSTNTLDGKRLLLGSDVAQTCTRWQEVSHMALVAARLGAATGVPCEFHLLNRRSVAPAGSAPYAALREGQDYLCTRSAAEVEALRLFLESVEPSGVTALAERLGALAARFERFSRERGDEPESRHSRNKLAFLVIATDGAPTPLFDGRPTKAAAEAALSELRRLAATLPLRLVVRLCTDEREAVDFWNDADKELELGVDVLDDLEAEAEQIAAVGNGWLAYSPALHALRESGTLVGLLDLLDERRLGPGEAVTLAGILLDSAAEGPLPDWKGEGAAFETFVAALRKRCDAAGTAFDARLRRRAPVVDADGLIRAIRRRDESARGVILLLVLLVCLLAVGWQSMAAAPAVARQRR